MRILLASALALWMTAAAAAEATVKKTTPTREIKALMSFTAPKGWTPRDYANAGGADPVSSWESGVDSFEIHVFGAPGSDFASPPDYQAVDESASAGTAEVAGRKLDLRKRGFDLSPSDPHHRSPVKSPRGTERYCVLPLKGGRFAVLLWRRASPAPDLERKGDKAWAGFLKSVRPK